MLESILIFLFFSSVLVAFYYALKRTNGNVFKSLQFALFFLAIKICLIGPNLPPKLDQDQSIQQQMCESSCIIPAKMSIERVIEVPNGGAVNHPWSPGAKYEANSTKTSSGKAPNLRRRRFLSLPGSNSRFNSDQQLPNPGYSYKKQTPSLNEHKPKPGRGIRVRNIATTDENGEMKTIYYNKDGQMIDRLDESKFLNDVDLARDGSPNPTNQHIQSETKSQAEDAHNQNSRLIKARNNLTPVKDDKLTSEGGFINSLELS